MFSNIKDASFLEEKDRNKLYLIWLAHSDFSKLKKQKILIF